MSARAWVVAVLAALAALLVLGRVTTALVVDHAWYAAMGLTGLWWEQVTDRLLMQGGTFVLGALFTLANLHAVRRTILAVAVPSRVANIELTAMIPSRRLIWITVVAAVGIGLALAAPLDDWTPVALARHGVAFGEIEGYLDRDLGFYLYQLPVEEGLYLWALVTIVTITAIVLLLYALTRSLRWEGRRLLVSSHVRRHLSVLSAIVLLLLAWSYRLDAFDVLRDGSGPNGEFLRVDHVVTLRVDIALAFACAVAALLVLRAGWVGQVRLAFAMVSLILVGALGLRQTLPALLARGNALGDPARRDVDYLATRVLVSRRAYDVDGIRLQGFDSTSRRPVLARADVERAVSLWDAPLARARLASGPRSGPSDDPVGWSVGPTGAIAILHAHRSIANANRWTLRGAEANVPMLRDSLVDLRTEEETGGGVGGTIVVAPDESGDTLVADANSNVVGARLDRLGMRIAHAWANRDPSLLAPDTIDGIAAKLVSHRDVRDRIAMVAAPFAQGSDIFPVVHEGTLYWAVDLYSASASYPLSERWMLAGEVRSYFRHAATALVDASTGRIRLVSVERPDPVARTWRQLAPTLFVDPAALPEALVAKLPPPIDGAIAQIRTFARYGPRSEEQVLRVIADSVMSRDGPTPYAVTLDGRSTVAFSIPLLAGGEQLDGVATAVGGARRAVYWDSTDLPRPRFATIAEQIRLALDSARAAIPEGTRRPPRVRPGHLQTVIVDGKPVFLQGLRWDRGDGDIVVSRVAVYADGRTGVGMTVAEALARRRGGTPSPSATPIADPAFAEPRDAAVSRLYDAMRDAMRQGDWTRFGQAFDSLGRALGRRPPG